MATEVIDTERKMSTEQHQSTNSAKPHYLTVLGVQLEYRYCPGDNNKPVLVFLHEGLGCTRMWHDFPDRLGVLTGCPVFVYSRQGYGRSAPCEVPRPLTYLHIEAREVLPAVLDAAGIGDHVLIGHSDGGSISLINAGSCATERLKAIVTMAPHIFCENMTVDAIRQTRDAYTQSDSLRQGLEKYHGENVDCAFWCWNKAWLDADFINWNIEEFLPAINVAQLVIQGEDDPYGTVAQVQGIATQSGGPVEVCMLPDCGHSPYKQKAEESLEVIKGFLMRQSDF